jgi:ankyrin repeat protein
LTKANLSSSQRQQDQQQQSSIDEKIARPSFGFGPPLLEACRRGASIENIKVILKHGADVNVHQSSNHVSALLTAVKSGRTDIAKLLIEAGANVNTVSASSLNGTTPLMAACVTGDLESCKLLVEKGKAHLNVRDANGNSAIMLARHHDCPDIVEYLLSKGATE